MSIPDLQSMMLPFLQLLADGKERFHKDILAELADKLGLSEEQQTLRHEKSGRSIFSNNIAWVETYLFKANLISKPRRACFLITEVGKSLLLEKPAIINIRLLKERYPSATQWLRTGNKEEENGSGDDKPEFLLKPPEELLENAHAIVCANLTQELLEQVKSTHWKFFERIVVDLLTKMGYGGSRQDAGKVVGKSGDNGIDGVINEDKLGLDIVYIQAKKYSDPITISQVRDFAGALLAKKARKGVFITTSTFPKSAEEFVAQIEPKVILIDGQRLAQLMIEYNVGVAVKDVYEVKRIDSDYLDENEYC